MATLFPEVPGDNTSTAAHDWLHKVIEHACHDFAGRVSHEHILEVAREVAARFRDARVTSYVPVLVGRFTRERLQQELREAARK